MALSISFETVWVTEWGSFPSLKNPALSTGCPTNKLELRGASVASKLCWMSSQAVLIADPSPNSVVEFCRSVAQGLVSP